MDISVAAAPRRQAATVAPLLPPLCCNREDLTLVRSSRAALPGDLGCPVDDPPTYAYPAGHALAMATLNAQSNR